MTDLDASQQLVLALDPGHHARVLGAPGTGKTRALVEALAHTLDRAGWDESQVLVLAPNRLAASDLRANVERRIDRAFGGTPVRTATSLAFAVLARDAAVRGQEPPRLLTGTVQDEEIASTVDRHLSSGASGTADLGAEALRSAQFRAELRELWRVVDDYGLDPASFTSALRALQGREAAEAQTAIPDRGLLERWIGGLELVASVAAQLEQERAGELSSSALLRAAAAAIRARGRTVAGEAVDTDAFPVPRLLLVDDAQELGEGDLALLSACASVGAKIWVFGDPDVATGAFHGERTAVLARLESELMRRGWPGTVHGRRHDPAVTNEGEQVVVLGTVHRHGGAVRRLVSALASRVGAAGVGGQRSALPADEPGESSVEFTTAGSNAEQLGIIAHRLRARQLGLGREARTPWSEMAVVCRSRTEALSVSRALAGHQVPTGVAAGGIVLREHQIVRELVRLLQHVLGVDPLTGDEVLALAGGVIGGLDPVAVRRLRSSLLVQERRDARAEGREVGGIDDLVLDAFARPGDLPVIDSAGGRVLRRLGMISAAAHEVRRAGGTPRETLWALWDGSRLAETWQQDALELRGARADEAHRSLDAVLGLFFALQRHEEQDSDVPIAELLEDLLVSSVPEDSLARRSEREAVTVTTPQGTLGREFSLVAVVGVQDGVWPNLRARGALLGTSALERWLRGGEALQPSRKDTMHDELRLLVQACSRARQELLVVAVADEDRYPSPFFGLGREFRVTGLPSARLTLRGVTADMRRRLTVSPGDEDALRALVALSREGAPGAHPHEWYGVLPPSSAAPLFDLDADPDVRVPVSPSQLESAETCPLHWVISHLGGARGSVQASLGTLVHHALETAESPDVDALFATVRSEWTKLPFEAEWESERAERVARAMTESLSAYLREFEASERELIGKETPFSIPIERAVLRGMADRLELVRRDDGDCEVTVLDLKTGRTPPSKAAAEAHAQLQAYQLGVALGAFSVEVEGQAGAEHSEIRSGGARLLYVHPDATKRADYLERVQQPLAEEAMQELRQRVGAIASVMASARFTARIEHHCSDPHQPGHCRIHVVPAVSRA